MDLGREIIALGLFLQQNNNDDDDDLLALLNAILLRQRQRRNNRRHLFLRAQMHLNRFRLLRGPIGRIALEGFVEMVWQYDDVQFAEDFRMPRQRFEVFTSSFHYALHYQIKLNEIVYFIGAFAINRQPTLHRISTG